MKKVVVGLGLVYAVGFSATQLPQGSDSSTGSIASVSTTSASTSSSSSCQNSEIVLSANTVVVPLNETKEVSISCGNIDNITLNTSNINIATAGIKNGKILITALDKGEAVITVSDGESLKKITVTVGDVKECKATKTSVVVVENSIKGETIGLSSNCKSGVSATVVDTSIVFAKVEGASVKITPIKLGSTDILISDGNSPTQKINVTVAKGGIIKFNSGWNLVSIPVSLDLVKCNLDDVPQAGTACLYKLGTYETIWSFNDNVWIENPTTIKQSQGFWVKMGSLKDINEVAFEGSSYKPNLTNLNSGWSLLGTGEELKDIKNQYSLSVVWSFVDNAWSKDPSSINVGIGFWVKK